MIPAPVEGVPAKAQLTGSLLASAVPGTGERWQDGVGWRPERCFEAAAYAPCDDTPVVPTYAATGVTEYYPIGFRVRDVCTTLGGLLDPERVRRQVQAATSFFVARELWTGALSVANPTTVNGSPYVNPHLSAGSTTVASTATGVAARLAALEQAAMVDAFGQQVVIHVPAHLVLPLGALLERRGDVLFTPLGNIVIADAGYPGSGPAGTGTEWAFSTGPVTVRLGEIVTISDPVSTINRETNRQEIWGDRMFAATFDPCTIYAIDTSASA